MKTENLFEGLRKQVVYHLRSMLLKKGGELTVNKTVKMIIDDELDDAFIEKLYLNEKGEPEYQYRYAGETYVDDFILCSLDEMYNILKAAD